MSRTTMLIDSLPDGWRNIQLGDLCDRVSDSYRPLRGGDTPYIGLEHLAQGFPAFVGRGIESDIKSQKTAFRANDVLFGKLRPYLRKGAKAGFDGVCSTDILALRPQEGCDPDFLQYLIHSDSFIAHAIATTTGVQHPRTSWPSLREFKLSAPPVSEQKGISKILASVQKLIETQEQIIQTTTELKQALMQKLFSEGLRGEPQKETEIGLVPESWETVSFDKFVTLQRGFDLRKQDFRNGAVPVVGATQVIGYHDTANVKAPGVTVVRSGSSAGKPHFISEDFWAHNVLLYVKDFQGNIPKFVYYKMLALNLAQYRQGVAVPTLNRNTLSAIQLALPSSSEQLDIADALDAVVNRMEVAKLENFQNHDLFRTLLCELMSAKIRVCSITLPVLQ